MSTNLNDLIRISSKQSLSFQWLNLRQLVQEVCNSLQTRLSTQSIEVELDIPETTKLWANGEMIRHVLLGLILNAIDAMPDIGQLLITSWSGPQGLDLEIADSRHGVGPYNIEQLFGATYSTKGEERGQGLAMTQQAVALHGGHIEVVDCPQGGAAFTLHFPQQPTKAAA